jgi:predicted site-specific integrase-resolvase|tara:strand:- start:161 stop:361 length:201 start_codon:yes stop_codon:yes gene_type:complete
MNQLANNSKAAECLGIAAATLQYWRTTGSQKIPFIKVGGRVMYRISDLNEWLEKNTFSHTGEYPTK